MCKTSLVGGIKKNVNAPHYYVGCFLCRVILGKRLKTCFGCETCKKVYHVNCFAIVHNMEHF